MKRLFSCVAYILFVHSVSASELTPKQFACNLEAKQPQAMGIITSHLQNLELNPTSDPGNPQERAKLLFEWITITRNHTTPIAVPLVLCATGTIANLDEQSKHKVIRLFQECLEEANEKGEDIYSLDIAK